MNYKIVLSRTSLVIFTLFIVGCATLGKSIWDTRYGKPTPREFKAEAAPGATYYGQIKPLIEQRCTVCHGCYDAPCQLKLDSMQGLLRGANPEKIYDGSRLFGGKLTRIFEDADTTAQWRSKAFHPIINERANTADANINASVIAQMLLLKKNNPLPAGTNLPNSFDFKLDKKEFCPTLETMDDYAKNLPLWGMPYALPGLNEKEHNLLLGWLEKGAKVGLPPALPNTISQQITRWETFLNGDSLKQQLVNRYIYEHLFLAQLFFDEAPNTYFRLVRSSTPPGQPLKRISTNRPFDHPGVERVYYRLWQDPASITAKNFMPYALNTARMQKWTELFFTPQYTVTELPAYYPEIASNPFVSFVELPIESRYRFMLDEAQFTIMNFIKGPVCRGQVALNVIQNNFWVFFIDPSSQNDANQAQFLKENSKSLQLPAEAGNTFHILTKWRAYAHLQKEYLVSKGAHFNEMVQKKSKLDVDTIWNGDNGKNKNAALTIYRHNDSASVHQGLIGAAPKTAWVIGYPLLERIHYLLVAGFDVYGNVSHQFLSRIYMDFLRMEGEMNFLQMLPKETETQEIQDWYRNADPDLRDYLTSYQQHIAAYQRLTYKTNTPKTELFQKLSARVGAAAGSPHNVALNALKPATAKAFTTLNALSGQALALLPENTLIQVPELGVFTLVRNNAYSNISSLFNEEDRRLPAEDSLAVVRGIIGAYPNAFMQVNERDLPDFAARINTLRTETDYQNLRDIYGVRRNNPDFWKFSDALLQQYKTFAPKEAALLDYNRLENR